MAAPTVTPAERALELDDIQGVVMTSWKELDHAAYLFVRFADGDAGGRAARRWLAGMVGEIARASKIDFSERKTSGPPRVQVALSASGMVALGAPPEAMIGFSDEAKQGMAIRARILGDGDDPASAQWELGPKGARIDALVLLYASGAATRDTLVATHTDRLATAGATVVATELSTALSKQEHFGFADGMSQPTIPGTPGRIRSGAHMIPAGEILLGYENAYGKLPRGPHGAIDLGRNGTYLVFRKLEQDVVAFWQYFAAQARELLAAGHGPGPGYDAAALDRWTDWLAAKVVGRWRSGASLVDAPEHDDPSKATDDVVNKFEFLAKDPHGECCPIGSHIRRANPRDARGGGPAEASRLVVGRHRILRRGRNWGPPLARDRALAGDGDGQRRGLHFICLQASIARGFEFVQQTWLSNLGFGGLANEADPIAGGEAVSGFTIPARPLRIRLRDMPRFVRTLGGGYFFLPSLTALEHLAR